MMRSPLHHHHITDWGTDKLYRLTELESYAKKVEQPHRTRTAVEDEVVLLGRNHSLFETLRRWAYTEVRLHTTVDGFYSAVEKKAFALNDGADGEPLPIKEAIGVAKSISKWVWDWKTTWEIGFRALQSRRAQKSVEVRQAKKEERYILIDFMVGEGFTNAQIADNLSVTLDAVKALKRRMRAEGLLTNSSSSSSLQLAA